MDSPMGYVFCTKRRRRSAFEDDRYLEFEGSRHCAEQRGLGLLTSAGSNLPWIGTRSDKPELLSGTPSGITRPKAARGAKNADYGAWWRPYSSPQLSPSTGMRAVSMGGRRFYSCSQRGGSLVATLGSKRTLLFAGPIDEKQLVMFAMQQAYLGPIN